MDKHMNLSRRAFVGGAAAFGVAVAAPKFAFAEPSAAEKQAEADAALQKLLKLNSDLGQKVKDYAAAVDASVITAPAISYGRTVMPHLSDIRRVLPRTPPRDGII